MTPKIVQLEKRCQQRKRTNKTCPGLETNNLTREAVCAVPNTIFFSNALLHALFLCLGARSPCLPCGATHLHRHRLLAPHSGRLLGLPAVFAFATAPSNATNVGRAFGRRRSFRAPREPTSRCAGRRRLAGRRPRASSLACHSHRRRRRPYRSGGSSRDVGRARYASLQLSQALFFGAPAPAASAVRALVARRPPASEGRVSRAVGTSLAGETGSTLVCSIYTWNDTFPSTPRPYARLRPGPGVSQPAGRGSNPVSTQTKKMRPETRLKSFIRGMKMRPGEWDSSPRAGILQGPRRGSGSANFFCFFFCFFFCG